MADIQSGVSRQGSVLSGNVNIRCKGTAMPCPYHSQINQNTKKLACLERRIDEMLVNDKQIL
ncbi:MAG TPA: hypothetical protein V6D48_21435 [Oculatellaceae cyanobacterium]